MINVFINGWNLGLAGVGQGVYTARILDGIQRHADPNLYSFTLFVDECDAARIAKRFVKFNIETLRRPRLRHPVLNQTAWNIQLTRHRALRDPSAVFFSPSPVSGFKVSCRTIVTCHDCIYRHFPVYLGNKFIRRWCVEGCERYLLKSDYVVTQSDHAAADIHRWTGAPLKRFVIIPAWLPPEYNSIFAKKDAHRVRNKYALPSIYWLYIGGYDVRKNLEFLIRAYASASRKAKCPPLVLAGKIPGKTAPTLCDVRGAIRDSGIPSGSLITPGFIDEPDLPGLYGGAALMVYPSLFEGYGLPPLEAMGCGCPAWVAENSSLPEVVRDPDYRFSTDHPDALADKMIRASKFSVALNPAFDAQKHNEASAINNYLQLMAGKQNIATKQRVTHD